MGDSNECAICLDNTIDIKNNCSCCKNGMCNSCCNKLIDRTFANLNDISYMCPFCNGFDFAFGNPANSSIRLMLYDYFQNYFVSIHYKF